MQFRITASNLTLRRDSDAMIQTQFNQVLGSATGKVDWIGVRFSRVADRIQCDVQATLAGNIAAYAAGWGETWLDAAHAAARELAKIVPAKTGTGDATSATAKIVSANTNTNASTNAPDAAISEKTDADPSVR